MSRTMENYERSSRRSKIISDICLTHWPVFYIYNAKSKLYIMNKIHFFKDEHKHGNNLTLFYSIFQVISSDYFNIMLIYDDITKKYSNDDILNNKIYFNFVSNDIILSQFDASKCDDSAYEFDISMGTITNNVFVIRNDEDETYIKFSIYYDLGKGKINQAF